MISQYDIRLATAADAAGISQLSRHAIEHGLSWSWTPRRVMRSVRDADTNVVLAHRESSLLGFGIMKYREEEAHLLLFAVQPVYRRRGIGSALLSWLERSARVAGIGLIDLEARAGSAAARAFYRRHGFCELGLHEGYYEGVEDAVRMCKQLRAEE